MMIVIIIIIIIIIIINLLTMLTTPKAIKRYTLEKEKYINAEDLNESRRSGRDNTKRI
jgi:predicted Holliday junction resolvase-like endonuclease